PPPDPLALRDALPIYLGHHPAKELAVATEPVRVDALEAGLELPLRANEGDHDVNVGRLLAHPGEHLELELEEHGVADVSEAAAIDRKSTRLNSSHVKI